MSRPFGLSAYRLATGLLGPLARPVLEARARAGKEDPARLSERLGVITSDDARPEGPMVWIHGASVGESMLGLALAARLRAHQPELAFLHTSGTRTSAGVIASRLGPSDLHRYVPLDLATAASRFVQFWRPDLAILVEGELWPNLIEQVGAAGIPLALVNARMTAKSLRGWKRARRTAQALLQHFSVILPADQATKAGLAALTERTLPPAGNLKLAAPVPAPPADLVQALKAVLAGRPVWLAASTHPGEEQQLVKIHSLLRAALPQALLILAPRHPERASDVEATCRMAGFGPVRRSDGRLPGASDGVWLWDTMGELPLAMALAPVTFMGGSLVPGVGGHNPVEPVALGSAVLSGVQVFNFADLFLDLEAADACRLCTDDHQLSVALASLMTDEPQRAAMVQAARAVVAEGAGAMDRAVAALVALLPEGAQ